MKKIIIIGISIAVFASCKKSSDTTTPPASTTTTQPATPAGGSFTNLHNFNDTNGGNPVGDLIIYNGLLYGMTQGDGSNYYGNIFSINTDGTGFKDMYDFTGSGTKGNSPVGDLTVYNGILYGMTYQGGTGSGGVIFSINPTTDVYTVLSNFGTGTNNGYHPQGSLTVSSTGLMYGTTSTGGTHGLGNIFSFNPAGNVYTNLYNFNAGGIEPISSLVLSGTVLYGTTYLGDPDNAGVVFSVNTDGSGYKALYKFGGAKGQNPDGSLLLSGTTLYGMTNFGGNNADSVGNIYSVSTTGTAFKDILDFNGSNGSSPYGAFIISGTTLYAMTTGGGSQGGGNVFSIDTTGSGFTNLVNFGLGGSPGAFPHGSLVLSNNVLYGMTHSAGPYGYGTIFSYAL
ncbi:MAG TPA: choice-of-anchor tandem repeat GloVer-containing protein [Bacteroidia bacterium]|jgi:uncharacterized repeat protein (TIGR03803 family)|nr:choice-of-anchor tandem repeat GloVer-containing protein [Bacteroidia bacterium]